MLGSRFAFATAKARPTRGQPWAYRLWDFGRLTSRAEFGTRFGATTSALRRPKAIIRNSVYAPVARVLRDVALLN